MATTFNSVDLGYCNSSGIQEVQHRFDMRTYGGVDGASVLTLGRRPKAFTLEGFFVVADGAAVKTKQAALEALVGVSATLAHEGASYSNMVCTAADFGKSGGVCGTESGVLLPFTLTFQQIA